MNNPESATSQEIIDAFMSRRGRWREAYTHGPLQQATQRQPVKPKPVDEDIIEGRFEVIPEKPEPQPRKQLQHTVQLQRIRKRQQAVYKLDWRMVGALALTVLSFVWNHYWSPNHLVVNLVINGLFFLLALDGLLLFVGFWYLKLVRAAQATCPNCGQYFGSARLIPLRVGGSRCQNCHISLPKIGLEET